MSILMLQYVRIIVSFAHTIFCMVIEQKQYNYRQNLFIIWYVIVKPFCNNCNNLTLML